MLADELRNCATYVEGASNAIEGADRGRELARLARRAAGDLDAYAKTAVLVTEIDQRVAAVLTWLDERSRNSRSFGSHADAYEIAARKLREAMGLKSLSELEPKDSVSPPGTEPEGFANAASASELLAAAKKFLRVADRDTAEANALRAAIAKAEQSNG